MGSKHVYAFCLYIWVKKEPCRMVMLTWCKYNSRFGLQDGTLSSMGRREREPHHVNGCERVSYE